MHDLQERLEQLTTGDANNNLVDQQRHLEALWNHLSRRLAQKQRMLNNKVIDLLKNTPSNQISSDAERIIEKWLNCLKDAVEKMMLLCKLLDVAKEIDDASLKQVFMVGCFIMKFLSIIYNYNYHCPIPIAIIKLALKDMRGKH